MEPRTNLHDLYAALHRPHRLHGDGSRSNLRDCWGNLLHGDCKYNGSPKLGGGVKTLNKACFVGINGIRAESNVGISW
jgi:hypothetical protein